jgi:TolB protein
MHKLKNYFTGLFLIITVNMYPQFPQSRIGSFDVLSDIGIPAIPGSASYSEPSQTYRISGSGSNIWFGEDSFSFLYKEMKGDFIFQTQIKFIGDGHELHRKTGIMFRSTKAKNSPMVACTIHGDGLTSLQFRKTEGANVEEIKFQSTGSDVLNLERQGNSYIMSVAHFGELYHTEKIENIDLGETVLAGLFVCSHNNLYSEEVEFTNTRVFKPAFPGLVQYKDYLGSCLEVMDVETGHRQVVASSDGDMEAPNSTPDGKTLMFNSLGLLYNFNLITKEISSVNSDFAIKNNNDHVLSFDGKLLGISHHAKETNGQSVIYTLPAEGGIPNRVTENSPSYLHGWSPDNNFLIYTAQRNGDFDIYKIPSKGGKEVQLTSKKGLDDGSEYSPDGKYIYFCSTRTGTMQVWRMDPDGKNQVQLTFDEMNNWFPHVSPDNKWITFISYSKEVPADKHPYYERVYLRMIPVAGGEPKAICYLYGGQGSFNVPSWSPDSKQIAFVSNGTYK